MLVRNEIIQLIKEHSGIEDVAGDDESISERYGIIMDDFHEFIEEYAEIFSVDMSDYKWYFHATEEGWNVGRYFFKAPYDQVERISVTPVMLEEFVREKKWCVGYPEHTISENRYDILFNLIFGILCVMGCILGIVLHVISYARGY